MDPMTKEDRDIQGKLKVLRHAEKTGHVARTCRYFGVGRSSFYRWKIAYEQNGEAGLVNAKPIPKNPANQTPPEIVDKVLYLRSKYHLGSIRIVWYLARYHGITISDAGVTSILRRNGVGRLPRGTRVRKVHTKRYNKQVPGHHIQMDVKFLTFIGKRGEHHRAVRRGHVARHLLARHVTGLDHGGSGRHRRDDPGVDAARRGHRPNGGNGRPPADHPARRGERPV
jgi:transposase